MIIDPMDIGVTIPQNPKRANLRVEAEKWIAANPGVYLLFVRFAHEMLAARKNFGVGLLTERVRWECVVTTTGDPDFKINNNHRAYIARKLVQDYPPLRPFIQFRETKY